MPYKRTGRKPGRPAKPLYNPGKRPTINPKWRAALKVEWAKFDSNKAPWPSTATGSEVALAAGVTRQMVWKWRRDPAYRAALFRLFAAEYWRDERKEAKAERDRRRQSTRSKRSSDANLHVYIKANWTGPIESPLDGRIYSDPNAFFQHIASHKDVVWRGDQPRLTPRKKGR